MAINFALIDKETQKAVGAFAADDRMCAAIGVPTDKHEWYKNWYNTIGLHLAGGHTFLECLEYYGDEYIDVVDHLSSTYDVESWRS